MVMLGIILVIVVFRSHDATQESRTIALAPSGVRT